MKRTALLVAGKVFNLSGDDAAEEVEREVGKAITLDLDVGPTVFQVGVSRSDKAVILHWTGMTNIRNIIWQRFILMRFRWPPFQRISCFINEEEVEHVSS